MVNAWQAFTIRALSTRLDHDIGDAHGRRGSRCCRLAGDLGPAAAVRGVSVAANQNSRIKTQTMRNSQPAIASTMAIK
jgi:hypothetical protein